MVTITEDYCSFKIAKLLKEKGFDEDCWCWYEEDGFLRESNDDFGNQSNSWHVVNDDEFNCSAPTHQMVLKWLREKYKIAINIRIVCKKTISYVFDIWDFNIIHPNKYVGGTIDLIEQQFDFKSYEGATEEAINYCLKNLI